MSFVRSLRSRYPAVISLLMTAIIILAAFTGLIPSYGVNAATIKTQKAANNVENGVYGIDVSKYQGTINWKKVAADDVTFAMCRATYGTDIDPTFVTNAKGAYDNGLHVGAYHYARFNSSATVKKEAEAFIKQLKKVTITYPVALDIEANPSKLSKVKLTNLCIEFMEILKENGYKVVVYSYQNFFTGSLSLNGLKNYNKWVANYLEEPTSIDRVMWQYSSKGRVSGISGDVDLNVAYGGLSSKRRAGSAGSITPYESIIDFLNEYYSASLNVNADHSMEEINYILYSAFQTEANVQLGASLPIDGIMTYEELDLLSDITFTQDQTKGRITTLIQSKLYFKRCIETISGVYDSTMVSALMTLQSECGLEPTGEMDRDTWAIILGL